MASLSVSLRGGTDKALEDSDKIIIIRKSAERGNFTDVQIRLFDQKLLRFFYAQISNVFCNSHTVILFGKFIQRFVEWKMMGVRDYVLGLECGNCYPDGRDVMRERGMLKFLDPGETKTYRVEIRMLDCEE